MDCCCLCRGIARTAPRNCIPIKPPLKGVTPHGVGRCPQGRGDRSVRGGPAKLVEGFSREVQLLVQPCRNRPAEFARCTRCPPVACQRRLLPLPVSGMLIFKCFPVKTGNFMKYGVCKFAFLGSPLGHPKGVPCAELSPQVTEGLPATAASRFHKELRFFFSLLKRKKEAKKEKNSHSTCTVRFQYHPKITQEILTNKTPPEGHTGGCCRRNTTLFTVEIGA